MNNNESRQILGIKLAKLYWSRKRDRSGEGKNNTYWPIFINPQQRRQRPWGLNWQVLHRRTKSYIMPLIVRVNHQLTACEAKAKKTRVES